MRIGLRVYFVLMQIGAALRSWATAHVRPTHITTDPACDHYRAARYNSAFHRRSRLYSCTTCTGRWARL
jgi:hypothetical protein